VRRIERIGSILSVRFTKKELSPRPSWALKMGKRDGKVAKLLALVDNSTSV
jgi:hypothetical protein